MVDGLILGPDLGDGHRMASSRTWILRLWASCLAIMALGTQPVLGPDSFVLEYYPIWSGVFTDACPNGGTTVVDGSEIGRMTYISMRFVNNGTVIAQRSTLTISNLVGCVVPWNPITLAADINPTGADVRGEVGVRPTAATWSFQLRTVTSLPG